MTTTQIARTDDGYRQATQTAHDCVCGTCGGELVVTWDHPNNIYRVGCPRRCADKAVKLRDDVAKDDIRERLERDPQLAIRMADTVNSTPLTTQALRALSDEQLQSRITVAFADMADATPALRGQIMALSKLYGLDPVFDLMLYQKRPYVTYPGRLRKLREDPNYHGHRVRPLSKSEKEDWGFKPEDIVVQCDADMGPHGIITDFGIVRAVGETSPVAKQHPQQLAIKRAVARCSTQAVGIDIPTIIDTTGRVVDVQEIRPRASLPAGPDAEAAARRRFWAVARGPAPDGLALDDAAVHRLLGVDSLTNYPGGWDQALSDLTERASATEDGGYEPPAETDDAQGAPSREDERAPEPGDGVEAADAGPVRAAGESGEGVAPRRPAGRPICNIHGCGKVVSADLLKVSQERFAAALCRSHFDEATAAGTPDQAETSVEGLPF